jgi:hypothetical protein
MQSSININYKEAQRKVLKIDKIIIDISQRRSLVLTAEYAGLDDLSDY